MPKTGMKTIRRDALIAATIAALGETGTLDVRVSDIARRAGVSAALAHHYFGGKDQLFDEAMRHLLAALGAESALAQRRADGPEARLAAILETNFSPRQFERSTITAWLIFYARALRHPPAARLLHIYARRLRSNLIAALSELTGSQDARRIADGAAALIDGLWLRAALQTTPHDLDAARRIVARYVECELAGAGTPEK